MESRHSGGDRTSPATSTGSLDLRRLSTRADSAYSSCSATSGGPEPRTPSPGTEVLPYLDWDYVRVVWGGPAYAPPDTAPGSGQRPRPEVAAPPESQGTAGPLSRRATPMLYALAAEAEAAARAAEPPSPPAARAAYRQRLQGAQRRVLRETSFQRRELRMSLPARLRPAAPSHSRSASLGHQTADAPPVRRRAPALGAAGPGPLAHQQRTWCFSEPGELDRVGRGGGPPGACWREACSRGTEPQEMPQAPQPRSSAEPEGPRRLGNTCRPGSSCQSTSGEVLGPWRGPGGTVATDQAVPQGAELPRPCPQTRFPRFLSQEGSAGVCPARIPQGSLTDGERRVLETCMEPARLPSLPDDEVFLEEDPLVQTRLPPAPCIPQEVPTSVPASDQQHETGLGQKADQAAVPPECRLHECPGTARVDDCWQGANGSASISRPTSCSHPGAANGHISTPDSTGRLTTDPATATQNGSLNPPSAAVLEPSGNDTPGPPLYTSLAWGTGQPCSRPTWPSQHLEELIQELARLDPSLGYTLASEPNPEPPLGLLDGLIPFTGVWAKMRSDCGVAGEESTGTSEPGSHQFSFAQLLPAYQEETGSENAAPHPRTDQPHDQGPPASSDNILPASQEETRPKNAAPHPVTDKPYDQEPPASSGTIQVKKVEVAGLLQKMLQDLQAEQEQLQEAAGEWARCKAALEAAVGQACATRELERFRRFMADLERVLGLLLLLGSRLTRVHRALARMGSHGDPEERASLLQRLGLLQRQQEDAKELKEHVARRERALREVLARVLPAADMCSYCALLADKAAILAQQRSLEERVRLVRDHLDTIRRDIGHRSLSSSPSWPPGTCSPDKPPYPPM